MEYRKIMYVSDKRHAYRDGRVGRSYRVRTARTIRKAEKNMVRKMVWDCANNHKS